MSGRGRPSGKHKKKQGFRPGLLRFLKRAVFIELVILVTVGLVCWFSDRRTAYHYSTSLMAVVRTFAAICVRSVPGQRC